MIELKCPFCQQELQEDVGYDGDYSCPNCSEPYFGSPELWQELIRTKELLEIEDAEHSMCHTQMLKTTEKLERTRKALEVAVDALKTVRKYTAINQFAPKSREAHIVAKKALQQIKEQQ